MVFQFQYQSCALQVVCPPSFTYCMPSTGLTTLPPATGPFLLTCQVTHYFSNVLRLPHIIFNQDHNTPASRGIRRMGWRRQPGSNTFTKESRYRPHMHRSWWLPQLTTRDKRNWCCWHFHFKLQYHICNRRHTRYLPSFPERYPNSHYCTIAWTRSVPFNICSCGRNQYLFSWKYCCACTYSGSALVFFQAQQWFPLQAIPGTAPCAPVGWNLRWKYVCDLCHSLFIASTLQCSLGIYL